MNNCKKELAVVGGGEIEGGRDNHTEVQSVLLRSTPPRSSLHLQPITFYSTLIQREAGPKTTLLYTTCP